MKVISMKNIMVESKHSESYQKVGRVVCNMDILLGMWSHLNLA